jgi:hypothetical protein
MCGPACAGGEQSDITRNDVAKLTVKTIGITRVVRPLLKRMAICQHALNGFRRHRLIQIESALRAVQFLAPAPRLERRRRLRPHGIFPSLHRMFSGLQFTKAS